MDDRHMSKFGTWMCNCCRRPSNHRRRLTVSWQFVREMPAKAAPALRRRRLDVEMRREGPEMLMA
jgi:hypothetical protein